jgi:DHA2 family multidrug resistance protein
VGVLIAALASGINNRVTDITLPDSLGVFGLGHDEGSWISTAYMAAEVSAMLIAPWFAITLSIRRFAIAVTLVFALLGILIPFSPNLETLLVLRVMQGLAGGALPPLLMTVALRFLPWHIKLYGLSAYALTATFGPNLAIPLAALWTEGSDWRLIFWQIVPAGLVAASLIAYGLPQDPLKLERFRQADWRGALLGVSWISMSVVALSQGNRLDWISSPLIVSMILGASVCLVLFLVNEWFHPLPLFKLQLFERRNFAYGVSTLCLFVVVATAGVAIPSAYLVHIHDYRPQQLMPLALMIALPQLLLAPAVAFVINRTWVDSRYVLATGLTLLAMACIGGSYVTADWVRENFYMLQALHAIGQPMVVVPLLMNATGVIAPMEGPFASSVVNTLRGMAAVIAGSIVENFIVHRERFHSNMLLDAFGANRVSAAAFVDEPSLSGIAARVRHQAFVMTFDDAFLALLAVLAALFLILLTVPKRAYPPQPPVTP